MGNLPTNGNLLIEAKGFAGSWNYIGISISQYSFLPINIYSERSCKHSLKKTKWTLKAYNFFIVVFIDLRRCLLTTKGQLILNWFFGVVNFLQKMNENKSTWGIIVVKSNSFVHFLEEKNISESNDLYP